MNHTESDGDLLVLQEQLTSNDTATKIDALDKLYALTTSHKGRHYSQLIAHHVTLPVLFQQLDTASEHQLESAVRLTERVMQLLPNQVTRTMLTDQSSREAMTHLLLLGSKHGYATVRLLSLEQIERLGVDQVFQNQTFVDIVSQSLLDHDLSVVKKGTQIILSWVRSEEAQALPLMFSHSSPFLQHMQVALNQGEVIRIRIHEIMSEIGCISEASFNACQQAGLVDVFIEDFMKNRGDILALLNLMEILKKWCTSKAAVSWLNSKKLFSYIVQMLVDGGDDDIISSFVFHLISDISALGYQVSEDFLSSDSPVVYNRLFESLQSDDPQKQKHALVIIGDLCSQSASALKEFLLDSPERRRYYLSIIEESRQQDISVIFLHSLAQIVEVQPAAQQLMQELEAEILPRYAKSTVSGNYLMNSLFDILRTDPFPENRHSVFHMIRSLAYHPWGVDRFLLSYPIFVDWLIDRNTEITKEAKDWKYGIAEVMWRTIKQNKSTCGAQLSSQSYVKVRVYLQRGPYLEDPQANVTISSKSA